MAEKKLNEMLDLEVRLAEVPKDGRKYTFSADGEARAELVAKTALLSVEKYEGELEIRPFSGGYQAKGKGVAQVEQACVVTLEPVSEIVNIDFERIYMPGEAPVIEVAANAEIFVNLDEEPDQDWFSGDKIDLAPMVVETLMLSLNPYPRKDGVALDDIHENESAASLSPFAALSALKDKK